MAFSSLAEIDDYMKTNKCEFWEAVIREEARDSQQPEMDIVNRMTQMYRSMKEADEAYDDSLTSNSGLSGKNGKKMADYAVTHKCMCGEFGGAVMARAIKMAESNAIENGRIQCLYEADRCSTDGRLLWCCACDIDHI